jgi:hypothetical protein
VYLQDGQCINFKTALQRTLNILSNIMDNSRSNQGFNDANAGDGMNAGTDHDFLKRLAASRSAFAASLQIMQWPLLGDSPMDGAPLNFNSTALQGSCSYFPSNTSASIQGGQSASAMFRLNQVGQRTSAMFGQEGVSYNQFSGASGPNNIRQAPAVDSTSTMQADREQELLLHFLIATRRRRQELHGDQGSPAVTENVMGLELLRLRQAENAAAAASSAATAAMFNAERQANIQQPKSIPSAGLQGAHNMLSHYGGARPQTTAGSIMPSNFGQPVGMIMPPAPPLFLDMTSQDILGNPPRPGSLGIATQGRLGVIDDDYIDDYLLSSFRQQHQQAMMAGVTEQQQQQRIEEHSPSRFLGDMTNPRNQLNHKSLDDELVANKRGEEFKQSTFEGGDLGKTTIDHPKKRKRICNEKKKPAADMPRRALSAYNLFFSEERERILLEIDPKRAQEKEQTEAVEEASKEQKHAEANEGDEAEAEEGGEESTEDTRKPKALPRLLLPSSQKKRRPHRKTHGKISFQLLARMVGQRWKALSDERRRYYQDLAQEDTKRQQRAMEDYYMRTLKRMKTQV